jgi:hypothetical protein
MVRKFANPYVVIRPRHKEGKVEFGFFMLLVRAWTLVVFWFFPADAFAAESVTYSYDVLGRVVEAKTTSGVTINNDTKVKYDPAGNRSCYSTGISSNPTGCTAAPTVNIVKATITFVSGSTTGFSELLSDGRTVSCSTSGPPYGSVGTVFNAPNIPYPCPF